MAIITIDNYQVNARKPIDTRMAASSSTDREAIQYLYDGLECFQIDTEKQWIYFNGTWSVEFSSNAIGGGTAGYVARWSATGDVENSVIFTTPDLSKIGINTTSPMEAFQINGTSSSKNQLTIRKDNTTSISDNLWFSPQFGGSNQAFDSTLGSSTLKYLNGGIYFEVRTPGSAIVMVTASKIDSTGFSEANFKLISSQNGNFSQPTISWSIDTSTGFYYSSGVAISANGQIAANFMSNLNTIYGDTLIYNSGSFLPIGFNNLIFPSSIVPTQSISNNVQINIPNRSGSLGILDPALQGINISNDDWITMSRKSSYWVTTNDWSLGLNSSLLLYWNTGLIPGGSTSVNIAIFLNGNLISNGNYGLSSPLSPFPSGLPGTGNYVMYLIFNTSGIQSTPLSFTYSGGSFPGTFIFNEIVNFNGSTSNVTISDGSFIKFKRIGSDIILFSHSMLLSSPSNQSIDKIQVDFGKPLLGLASNGFASTIDVEKQAGVVSTYTIVKVSNVAYNTGGAKVFNPGYGQDGQTGTFTTITTPHFWVNGAAPFNNATRNNIDGRMNAAGIWFNPLPAGHVYVGFTRVFNVPSTKTYYIGMAADNFFKIYINGNLIINMTLSTNFLYMNIYPVTLNAGANIIQMYGADDGNPPASMVAEVYNNTLADLQAATNISMLNVLFTTGSLVGQSPDLVPSFGPIGGVRTEIDSKSTAILLGAVGNFPSDTFSVASFIGRKGTGYSMTSGSTYRVSGYGLISATNSTPSNLPPGPPVVSPPPTINVVIIVNQFFSQSFTATNSPSIWSTSTIPAWMNFTYNGSSATLSGTPPSPTSTTNVIISASNIIGTGQTSLNYTVNGNPSVNQISNSDNTPAVGYRTQVFQIGQYVSAGNQFSFGVYSGTVVYTAVNGDTPSSVASNVANLINQGRNNNVVNTGSGFGRWRDCPGAPSTPPGGANSFFASYPSASPSGANVTIILNEVNQFAGSAF